MKKIIYTVNGAACICHPSEGFRNARYITLADGTVLPAGADKIKRAAARAVDSILRQWPVDGAVAEWAETEDEFVARIAAKDVPAGATDVRIVDASEIPADRTFRDAWVISAGKITHDMAKCRELHKAKLRELRAPKLSALDVQFMRAVESGDAAAQKTIAEQKRALRDVTADPAISAAKTPAELSIPADLR